MRMMKAMVAYNEGADIEVGPWPDTTGWTDRYEIVLGACFSRRHEFPEALQVAKLFMDFHKAVLQGRVSPEDAHREFLKIDEYRWHIPREIDGAADMPANWERKVLAP